MKPTILLINFQDQQKLRKLKMALLPFKLRIKTIEPQDYSQPIGYLAGVKEISQVQIPSALIPQEQMEKEMLILAGIRQIVLSLLVDNNPGVLARVAALFSRRGYNIDSITAGITNDPKYTRITVAVSGDNQILEQIRNQIAKLVEVRKIVELENSHSVCRELVLVKVMADKKEKQEIIAIADIFRAKVVDVAANSLMIELTGNQNKLDAFLNLMADFEVLEMVRTGITGLGRGVSTLN